MSSQYLADCCVEAYFEAEPELVLWEGDIDPFTDEEIIWPNPRVYWSNSMVTDGCTPKGPEEPR